MKKHKIKSLSKYANIHEEKTVIGKDGTEVVVRSHIPYVDKVKMAQEIIEDTLMIHDDSCHYTSYEEKAIINKKVLEYYTDIQTDDADAGELIDFVVNNELMDGIMSAIENDYDVVDEIMFRMKNGVSTTFDDDRSLRKAVRRSFGFLFTGEDLTKTLAKAEIAKDTIFSAVNEVRKIGKEKETQINDGALEIGGNIIEFARKE